MKESVAAFVIWHYGEVDFDDGPLCYSDREKI